MPRIATATTIARTSRARRPVRRMAAGRRSNGRYQSNHRVQIETGSTGRLRSTMRTSGLGAVNASMTQTPAIGIRMAMRTTNRGSRSRSVGFEGGVELPAGDLLLIALPLHLLCLDETFKEVATQRVAHHIVLAQVAKRRGERPGQLTELVARECLRVEGVEILLDRRRERQT